MGFAVTDPKDRIPVPAMPTDDGVEQITYLCACGRRVGCCAMPWSPREAIHICPFCERKNKVFTRPSFMDEFKDGTLAEGIDRTKLAHRVSTMMPRGQFRADVEAVKKKLGRSESPPADVPVVMTSLGPAILIGNK